MGWHGRIQYQVPEDLPSLMRIRLARHDETSSSNAMKSARNVVIVLVTAPELRAARALAQGALKARLIACANLVPRLESHYWWQEKSRRPLKCCWS
jgi:periplasmic divalent cation tolerance protein